MTKIKAPKKLIEVALPLDDINAEAAREKSIRHGHPSTLHLWWARRPLAAARAVLFAQLVNDPGYERHLGRGMNKEAAQKERERLFDIIRRLVKWENTNNEEVLNEAREEIRKSWRETCELNKGIPGFDPGNLPAFHDPFSGGGAIPLEAQRLGLESYASDLNPVAVMINKAMIEIPPKFAGLPAVNLESRQFLVQTQDEWRGARGLAEDVRYYGKWMRDEAFKRIGHLYPEVDLPEEYGGGKGTVIAWLWARTVKSPNPVYSHVDVPLVSSYILSTKSGKEVYLKPIIQKDNYSFEVVNSKLPLDIETGTKLARGANFKCILSGVPISPSYIKSEGIAGKIGAKLLAVVVEGTRGRIYLPATKEHVDRAFNINPTWFPELRIPDDRRSMFTPLYGLTHFRHLFTNRQLFALTTLSDLVLEVREIVLLDSGSQEYANAISLYLSFITNQIANHSSSICGWNSSNAQMRSVFARQALPMVWDFAESNIFSNSTGSFNNLFERQIKGFESLGSGVFGKSIQADAIKQNITNFKIVSTDPPYYDNIGYADLSDFFYVWMRKSLNQIYPDIFKTLSTPKFEELVATPYRHGTKEKAENFFLSGMTEAMKNIATNAQPSYPVTIYYAFKQSETEDNGTSSTGWITFLSALIKAGFVLTGTWPLKTEKEGRVIGNGTNALASSIVLVCRSRSKDAGQITRRQFIRELNDVIPDAINTMVGGIDGTSPISAVDLQQASIGPGMAIFSKYSSVIEADGSIMTVKIALQLINRAVDAFLNTTDGTLDGDTLYCLTWFEQYGWNKGDYGQAEVLATAKGTTINGMRDAGVLESGQGKVRLFKWQEYPKSWKPDQDNRTPVWEALHQLIRELQQQGELSAGQLLAGMPARSDSIRNLAYRLYTLCERKGWAEDARAYNELIESWDSIESASNDVEPRGGQLELF